MRIHVELSEKELRELVYIELYKQLGSIPITKDDIKIEVKSKQNYKSEWEVAAFRATVNKET